MRWGSWPPPGELNVVSNSLILRGYACHEAKCTGPPRAGGGVDAAKCIQLALAPTHGSGCNRVKHRPSGMLRRGNSQGGGPMHGTIDLAGDSHQRAARDRANSIPLSYFDVSNPELFKT